MAGSHVGLSFNIEDLKGEQIDIDKLIDNLLSGKGSSGDSLGSSSPVVSSQQRKYSEIVTTPAQVPVKGRGPGRPRATRSGSSSAVPVPVLNQPKSPAPTLQEGSSINVIIDCLNRINLQNKKLLNIVENIVDKVDSESVVNKITPSVVSTPEEAPAVSGALKSVNSRLEKLEQEANQNILICRGTTTEALIKDSDEGGRSNLERLKTDLFKSISGNEVNFVPDVNVSLYGKIKKVIRIECPNFATKIDLIKRVRQRKPEGLYLNEFLTESRLRLYLSARSLKKLHPNKIKAVFTRGGVVCYTLADQTRFHHLNTIEELERVIGLANTSS